MRIFQKSEFGKNALTLMSGTVLAQLIPVLLQPLLRRVYDPADFGLFAVYLSLVGMFSVVSNARFDMAIVVAKDERKAMQIFMVTVLINFIFCMVFWLIYKFFEGYWQSLLNVEEGESYLLEFFPLSMFLLSLGYSANNVLIRRKEFKLSAMNKAVRRGSEGLVQGVFGFLAKSVGLVVGDLIGHMSNIIILIRHFNIRSLFSYEFSPVALKDVFREYLHFPKYNAIPTLLNSLSLLLPVIIVNNKYNAALTGQFDLSRQMLAIPLVFISASLSQVLFQKLSEMRNERKSIRKQIFRLIRNLALASVAGILVFELVGMELFVVVFGEEWRKAGLLAEILIISSGAKFIVSTVSIVLTALEKLKILALWQFFYFVLIIGLFVLPKIEIEVFLQVLVAIDVLAYGAYFLIIRKEVLAYEKGLAISEE